MADTTLPGASAPADGTDSADRLEIKAEQLAALMRLLMEDDFSCFYSAGKRTQMSLLFMLHELVANIEALVSEVVAELHAAQGEAA